MSNTLAEASHVSRVTTAHQAKETPSSQQTASTVGASTDEQSMVAGSLT